MATPRFSILTPVYETPADVLRKMLRSVRRQSFGDWELCLVDDGSQQAHVREILDREHAKDPRIRVERRESNDGIVAASNDALGMASGEFLALLDHDDLLHPDALAHVAEAIDRNPDADYVYTDEDKIDLAGRHSGPFFKPDWSPERMRTQMYTCHLSVLRRSLVEEVGGFDAEFEGSQDWDLVLRVTERARTVVHVPQRALPLAHARDFRRGRRRGGQAMGLRSGPPCGAGSLQPDRLSGQGRPRRRGPRRPPPRAAARASSRWSASSSRRPGRSARSASKPVVLVLNCVRSILERSTYKNYEIVCRVDDSVQPLILQELRDIAGDRLRLVRFPGPFDFSAKINFGAVRSEGEHLLLLNDDIEVDDAELDRAHGDVLRARRRSASSAVKLLWGDTRLQHVGVGFDDGLPGHIYRGFPATTTATPTRS